MEKCFVMQPFDGGGAFDKRYEDVFAPAIEDAGLEPYRVDRDPKVSIPIEDIEKGIEASSVCFAEITTDNPNVWFELGYAIASRKEVILVCSSERKSKFPFDVQHRSVITYTTDSPSDFAQLRGKISEKTRAMMKKESQLEKLQRISPLADTEGLAAHEVVALATVMQNRTASKDPVSAYVVKNDMYKGGFTDIAVSIALTRLVKKALLEEVEAADFRGEEFWAYMVTPSGEDWLMNNSDKLALRRHSSTEQHKPISDDDIPF